MALSDKKAIQAALWIAIDTEEALIDAYRDPHTRKVDEDEAGVKIARHRIAAFKRVLARYYPGKESPKENPGRTVPISELLRQPDPEDPSP